MEAEKDDPGRADEVLPRAQVKEPDDYQESHADCRDVLSVLAFRRAVKEDLGKLPAVQNPERDHVVKYQRSVQVCDLRQLCLADLSSPVREGRRGDENDIADDPSQNNTGAPRPGQQFHFVTVLFVRVSAADDHQYEHVRLDPVFFHEDHVKNLVDDYGGDQDTGFPDRGVALVPKSDLVEDDPGEDAGDGSDEEPLCSAHQIFPP